MGVHTSQIAKDQVVNDSYIVKGCATVLIIPNFAMFELRGENDGPALVSTH